GDGADPTGGQFLAADRTKPPFVFPAPGGLAGERVAAAQQQFPQPVAGAHQVPSGIVTRTDQIADGLLAESRDPHGSDVVIASQSGQQYRVAAIGLDPLARWPQQFRGGCDLDRMTRLCQEAGKSEAGGASLVRDPQRAMITSEALDELADHDQVIRKSLLDQLARGAVDRGRDHATGMNIQSQACTLG